MAIMSPPQYILQMYSISAFAMNLYVWYSFQGFKKWRFKIFFYLKRVTSPPPFFLKDSRSSLDKLQCRDYILNKCNPRTTVDDVDMAIVWWICLTECNPWTKVDDVDPTVVCSSSRQVKGFSSNPLCLWRLDTDGHVNCPVMSAECRVDSEKLACISRLKYYITISTFYELRSCPNLITFHIHHNTYQFHLPCLII